MRKARGSLDVVLGPIADFFGSARSPSRKPQGDPDLPSLYDRLHSYGRLFVLQQRRQVFWNKNTDVFAAYNAGHDELLLSLRDHRLYARNDWSPLDEKRPCFDVDSNCKDLRKGGRGANRKDFVQADLQYVPVKIRDGFERKIVEAELVFFTYGGIAQILEDKERKRKEQMRIDEQAAIKPKRVMYISDRYGNCTTHVIPENN